MTTISLKLRTRVLLTLAAATFCGHSVVQAAGLSLKGFTVPEPTALELAPILKDRAAAIKLGKALFWDMQVGSDGIQACASCHFNAGADSRAKNQVSPGLLRSNQFAVQNKDISFKSGNGPNATLQAANFPFHRKTLANDRLSPAVSDTNDIVSSQGVFNRDFVNVIPGIPFDVVTTSPDTDGFKVNDINVRRVEPRNTPSVINAVFNFRNFWDGRAQNDFNGVSPFGSRDPDANLFKFTNGTLVSTRVSLSNSSLASQAVGPPGNEFEMSARGRPFAKVGVKMLSLRPLARQHVATDDSVLGPLSRAPEAGLTTANYKSLVESAFKPEWYGSDKYIRVNADGTTTFLNRLQGILSRLNGEKTYTQMEYNFSLFFGLAVQMYQATLVSDETLFDKAEDGLATLPEAAQRGKAVFFSDMGRCGNCHGGNELTDASVTKVSSSTDPLLLPQRIRRRSPNVVDLGFNNIGVTKTLEDLGLGGKDNFNNPLSETRWVMLNNAYPTQYPLNADTKALILKNLPNGITAADVLGVDGAFKIPQLRNVELTAPYFHNGGTATLSDVIDFYFRGGDFNTFKMPIDPATGLPFPLTSTNVNKFQSSTNGVLGFSPDRSTAVGIRGLSTMVAPNFDNTGGLARLLTQQDKDDLLAFLITLTDERVRIRSAPFDHPQLFVPNGQVGDDTNVVNLFGYALDNFKEIPATGQNGGVPLAKFLDLPQP